MPKNIKPGNWDQLGVHVLTELERLNDAQRDIHDVLDRNTATLDKNTTLLEEHMRRTEAAEKSIDVLKDELLPVKTNMAALKLIAKIGAGFTTLITLVLGILKALGKL